MTEMETNGCRDAKNWHSPSSWASSGTKAPATTAASVTPRIDFNFVLTSLKQSPPHRPQDFELAYLHRSALPFGSQAIPFPLTLLPRQFQVPSLTPHDLCLLDKLITSNLTLNTDGAQWTLQEMPHNCWDTPTLRLQRLTWLLIYSFMW